MTNAMLSNAWQIPESPGLLWKGGSTFVITSVGLLSKLLLALNSVRVHKKDVLFKALDGQKNGRGLITVSNHHSCIDDPLMWGILKVRHLANRKKMRLTLVADDVCCKTLPSAHFVCLGNCVPICRGEGVYQKGVDYSIDRLNNGDWVHVFPEGKVNVTKEIMRLKWGVGRLVSETEKMPIVLPIYHCGMDNINPNERPYWRHFKLFHQKVTIVIGDPLDFTDIVLDLKRKGKSQKEIRKEVTDLIQDDFRLLGKEAGVLHNAR